MAITRRSIRSLSINFSNEGLNPSEWPPSEIPIANVMTILKRGPGNGWTPDYAGGVAQALQPVNLKISNIRTPRYEIAEVLPPLESPGNPLNFTINSDLNIYYYINNQPTSTGRFNIFVRLQRISPAQKSKRNKVIPKVSKAAKLKKSN